MALYKQNAVKVVSAEIWNKNGDHSEDDTDVLANGKKTAGRIVRRFPHENIANRVCPKCQKPYAVHGWLTDRRQSVCPGSYIVTAETGERHTVAPAVFNAMFTAV